MNKRRMNLMLVDDDPVSRGLLRQILGREPGVSFVAEAEDGQAAWELLERRTVVDICVLDLMMPRMGGLEFLRKVRAEASCKNLKVIVCSVVRDTESIRMALDLEVDGYILKPFKADMVRQIFERTALQAAKATPVPPPPPESCAVRVLDNHLIDMLAFFEHAREQMDKLRLCLDQNKRREAWALSSGIRELAQRLQLEGMYAALVQLDLNIMSADLGAAHETLQSLEWVIQSLASYTLDLRARARQAQCQVNAFAI